jgi:hypothetical protein
MPADFHSSGMIRGIMVGYSMPHVPGSSCIVKSPDCDPVLFGNNHQVFASSREAECRGHAKEGAKHILTPYFNC